MKNIFVAAPLIFSKRLDEPRELGRVALAVGLFCALSSAVYLWNDVVDVEKDRAHPVKKKRPVASGRLSIGAARAWALGLALGALGTGLLVLEVNFGLAAGGYLILNAAYSLKLKRIVYVDVVSISAGFLLRVVAGAAAARVWISPWLLVCTALLACFFGFGKRAHELGAAGDKAHSQRSVLAAYNWNFLNALLIGTGVCTLAAYILYTQAEHTRSFFGTDRMIWTAPFAALGLLRFGQLVTRHDRHDSPTDAMLRDWPFLLIGFGFGAASLYIIYFR